MNVQVILTTLFPLISCFEWKHFDGFIVTYNLVQQQLGTPLRRRLPGLAWISTMKYSLGGKLFVVSFYVMKHINHIGYKARFTIKISSYTTAWSSWKCTENCGNGKNQFRTRRCTGCSGGTRQMRCQNCKPQHLCYCR